MESLPVTASSLEPWTCSRARARGPAGIDINAVFLSALYVSALHNVTGFYQDIDVFLYYGFCDAYTPLSSTFVHEEKTSIGRRRRPTVGNNR